MREIDVSLGSHEYSLADPTSCIVSCYCVSYVLHAHSLLMWMRQTMSTRSGVSIAYCDMWEHTTSLVKIYQTYPTIFWDIVACAPSMLKIEMLVFISFLKLMLLISHPKLFLKIIVPKLSSHVSFKSWLTKPDNIEGARFFKILSCDIQHHIIVWDIIVWDGV